MIRISKYIGVSFIRITLVLFAAIMLAACSKENYNVSRDENGVLEFHPQKSMTKAGFNEKCVGYGWKDVGFRLIDDEGNIGEYNSLEDWVGAGGPCYYFSDEVVTIFQYYDWKPANCRWERTYDLNEDGYLQYEDPYFNVQVVSVGDEEMTTVKYSLKTGMPVRMQYYVKMSSETLSSFFGRYTEEGPITVDGNAVYK